MPTRCSILVVDDDPNVVAIMNRAAQSVFEEAQFIPTHTFDAAAAYLERLSGIGPRFILLDVNLQSELSGLDFLTRLRQHPQGRVVPVIILSSNEDPASIQRAYEQGANAYTLKPFSFQEWKEYLQVIRYYWFDSVSLPILWFEEDSPQRTT